MLQRISSWKTLLFSVLTYCGNTSSVPDASIEPRCQEMLQCIPESLEDQCSQASVYAVLPLDKASDRCLSEFDPWPFWFPSGHFGVNQEFYVQISRCNFDSFEGRKYTHQLEDRTVNRIIGSEGQVVEKNMQANLQVYCKIPCNDQRINLGKAILPLGSALIVDTGVPIQLDMRSELYQLAANNPHLIYALEFQENNPDGGGFFARYCVLARDR